MFVDDCFGDRNRWCIGDKNDECDDEWEEEESCRDDLIGELMLIIGRWIRWKKIEMAKIVDTFSSKGADVIDREHFSIGNVIYNESLTGIRICLVVAVWDM